jgi:hypothetical protein
MTLEWWMQNVFDAQSKIRVVCKQCGWLNHDATINQIQQHRDPGCWCKGGKRLWCSQQGWRRCLAYFQENCEQIELRRFNVNKMTWDWWQANIRNCKSKCVVTCTICGYENCNFIVSSLRQRKAPGCLCLRKTEKKLGEWLRSTYGEAAVLHEATWPELRGRKGRFLRCDFYLKSYNAVVELDGHIGHFGRDWRGCATLAPARRDLRKERFLVAKGITVIRLLQPDVWQDSWDWQNFLTQTLNEAQAARRGRVVLQPGAREYADPQGVYAELRRSAARRSLRRRLWRGAFLVTGRDERP